MSSQPGTLIETVVGYADAVRRLTRSGDFAETELAPEFASRIEEVFGEKLTAREVVERIVSDVREQGDAAVSRYTTAFDNRDLDHFDVPREEWDVAWDTLDGDLQDALLVAATRITSFHTKQLRQSWIEPERLGIFGQIVRPLERIGIYVPGGSAALPSSLMMIAIPAKVAGVREIIISAPPRHDGGVEPVVLAAAKVSGVDRVFSIGGAQAIAAMAFGTESVPHVDKILGPGNIFVALAKQRVYGAVDIDQLAGPTETMLIADESADIELIAADMLAQAEHDFQASAILVTTSTEVARGVPKEMERQLKDLDREEIARGSLRQNGLVAKVADLGQAVALANTYAPEHLCLLVKDPWSLVPEIENTGGIFIGEQSPEALGDYTAGPSHVMPTGGTARFSSPVNVRDFQKVISIIGANERAVGELGPATMTLALAEGLGGHAAAIQRRMRRLAAGSR
jgi:histidinol dehydrogenase